MDDEKIDTKKFWKHVLFIFVAVFVIAGMVNLLLYLGWLKNPEKEDSVAFVSGTEYFPNQEGQVALMVVKANGQVVTFDYACNHTILYPNKTMFKQDNYTMNTSLGTYYTNFTVPDIEGVFEYQSTCSSGGQVTTAGKSFHVTRKKLQAVTPK